MGRTSGDGMLMSHQLKYSRAFEVQRLVPLSSSVLQYCRCSRHPAALLAWPIPKAPRARTHATETTRQPSEGAIELGYSCIRVPFRPPGPYDAFALSSLARSARALMACSRRSTILRTRTYSFDQQHPGVKRTAMVGPLVATTVISHPRMRTKVRWGMEMKKRMRWPIHIPPIA